MNDERNASFARGDDPMGIPGVIRESFTLSRETGHGLISLMVPS